MALPASTLGFQPSRPLRLFGLALRDVGDAGGGGHNGKQILITTNPGGR